MRTGRAWYCWMALAGMSVATVLVGCKSRTGEQPSTRPQPGTQRAQSRTETPSSEDAVQAVREVVFRYMLEQHGSPGDIKCYGAYFLVNPGGLSEEFQEFLRGFSIPIKDQSKAVVNHGEVADADTARPGKLFHVNVLSVSRGEARADGAWHSGSLAAQVSSYTLKLENLKWRVVRVKVEATS